MSNLELNNSVKDYIAEALFILMEKKPYDKISISEIAEKAGVGRATYYRHFKTKDEVIYYNFACYSAEFDRFERIRSDSLDDFYELLFMIFSTLKEKQEIVKRLLSSHLELLYLNYLTDSLKIYFVENGFSTDNYSAEYIAGSLFNVSISWVKNGCSESVKQITDSFFDLQFHILESLYINKEQNNN